MIVGSHKRACEYDGAYKCLDCQQSWGALPNAPRDAPAYCLDKSYEVPLSWKLVPIEPTDEILEAMTQQCDGYNHKYYHSLYKAMLSAAPQPPKEQR